MSAALLVLTGCLVIGVPDGDSLKVKCPKRDALSVRVAEIDAPEIKHPAFKIDEQPWGAESKASLTELCLKKPATLRVVTQDRYGRTVARVTCNRVNVAAHQVRTGNAWADFVLKDSKMPALQEQAQKARMGLWSLPNPIAPSEWRRGCNK